MCGTGLDRGQPLGHHLEILPRDNPLLCGPAFGPAGEIIEFASSEALSTSLLFSPWLVLSGETRPAAPNHVSQLTEVVPLFN